MPQKLEGDIRNKIAEFLPNALKTALDSYHIFSDEQIRKKAEGDTLTAANFKSHHDACKMALSHLQLLLKVADELQSVSEAGMDNDRLQSLLESARKELNEK